MDLGLKSHMKEAWDRTHDPWVTRRAVTTAPPRHPFPIFQTRKNLELSIILTSLIFHCELARINFCPPRSSIGVCFCGGNSAETRWTKNPSRWELEWGKRKIRGGLKDQPHRFGGGGILKNHLSCTVAPLNQ